MLWEVLNFCKEDEKDQRTCCSPLVVWKDYRRADMYQIEGHELVKIEFW